MRTTLMMGMTPSSIGGRFALSIHPTQKETRRQTRVSLAFILGRRAGAGGGRGRRGALFTGVPSALIGRPEEGRKRWGRDREREETDRPRNRGVIVVDRDIRLKSVN